MTSFPAMSLNHPLRELILRACPPNPATGMSSIRHLAKLLDMSEQGIFQWFKTNTIPPKRAAEIVDLSEGRVTLADFSPWVYFQNLDT